MQDIQSIKAEYPFTTISRELWLLLACADRDEVKAQALAAQLINWDIFIEMAVHHRVYPLAYQTLSSLAEQVVPARVLDYLQKKYQANAWQAMRMAGETVRVVKLLTNDGIHTAVLKGGVLAMRLYGDLAARPSRDIDLLVRADDLKKADGLLLRLGYRRDHPDYPMTPKRWQICLQNNRHFSYVHQKTGIYLELHWQIGQVGMELPHAAENAAETVEIASYRVPVFAAEEWFLFLVQHGASHSWFRLRWLCDIAAFMRQGDRLDWAKVVVLAECYDMCRLLQQALILTNLLLDIPIPRLFSPILSANATGLHLAELAVPFFRATYDVSTVKISQKLYYWQKAYQFQLRTGWRNKMQYTLLHFGATEDDILRFPLPDCLYWLYYLIRPFIWLERRLKRGD